MEAERDVITMLKLEFMKDKVGEVYDGIITGVLQFGFFVQLQESLRGRAGACLVAQRRLLPLCGEAALAAGRKEEVAHIASATPCGCGWTASTPSGSGSIFRCLWSKRFYQDNWPVGLNNVKRHIYFIHAR